MQNFLTSLDKILNGSGFSATYIKNFMFTEFIYRSDGLFNILEVSSEFNTDWLINSGTSFEYSGSTHKLSEGIKTKPRSYYGVFKSAATNLLSLYSPQ